jgi:hypothetical protein
MTKDEALVYAVEGNDAFSNLMHGGETCRGSLNTNMGAARMERDEENHRFVTTIISLHDMHGNNVVIYACVLTMCSSADALIHFYTDNPVRTLYNISKHKMRTSSTHTLLFATELCARRLSSCQPVPPTCLSRRCKYQYLYTFQSGRGYAGISACHGSNGCSLYYSTGRGGGSSSDGNGVASGGCLPHLPRGGGGYACPPEGTKELLNNAGFALFFVEGNAVIYACSNGVVIGRCVFRSGPSPPAAMIMSVSSSDMLWRWSLLGCLYIYTVRVFIFTLVIPHF